MPDNTQATAKYLRLSPHKVRRILDQIRGKSYKEGLLLLEFMPYKACLTIRKLLESAAANMTKYYDHKKNNLIIKKAFTDKGPTLKRFRARAQGRAFPIAKPTCHITIQLSID
uniref:Large ribosomal subunit protein uL22c n=1 Tax=Rhodogorgon sp. TaxID=2485824 RepID=A0A3G3MHY5_9FLOR|nr:ribosomal protein L22 [Rhodogorgon sp.]